MKYEQKSKHSYGNISDETKSQKQIAWQNTPASHFVHWSLKKWVHLRTPQVLLLFLCVTHILAPARWRDTLHNLLETLAINSDLAYRWVSFNHTNVVYPRWHSVSKKISWRRAHYSTTNDCNIVDFRLVASTKMFWTELSGWHETTGNFEIRPSFSKRQTSSKIKGKGSHIHRFSRESSGFKQLYSLKITISSLGKFPPCPP